MFIFTSQERVVISRNTNMGSIIAFSIILSSNGVILFDRKISSKFLVKENIPMFTSNCNVTADVSLLIVNR